MSGTNIPDDAFWESQRPDVVTHAGLRERLPVGQTFSFDHSGITYKISTEVLRDGKSTLLIVINPRNSDGSYGKPSIIHFYEDGRITDGEGATLPNGVPPETVAILRAAVASSIRIHTVGETSRRVREALGDGEGA